MEDILPKNGLPIISKPFSRHLTENLECTPLVLLPDRYLLLFAHLEPFRSPSDIVHTKPDWQKDLKQPNAVIYIVIINSLVTIYIEKILNCMTAWKNGITRGNRTC